MAGESLHKKIASMTSRDEAQELIRTQQQGLGKPIVSTGYAGGRVVAVKNKVYYSKKWKYFADFLEDYLWGALGSRWGKAELEKPLNDRHPILQWHQKYCAFRRSVKPNSDGDYWAEPTGVVQCYLGLAYGLYLLAHNVELQNRLVIRLKDSKNFQGAYYEVIVANILIRAGFALELEDETDTSEKHCEFSAISQKTGRQYWVEAKMRSVAGVMGKTEKDGCCPTAKPTSRLTTHLRESLSKPAKNERLIFIDVNAPEISLNQKPGPNEELVPNWMLASIRQLDAREKDLKGNETAYVFVTNFPFHWHLDVRNPTCTALAHGLGMDDFGKPGACTFVEAWRNKQKHIDAHNVLEEMRSYPSIPPTFDGVLPLPEKDTQNRILIGDTYFFEELGDGGVVGTVTSATVNPEKKTMHFAISTTDGEGQILEREMSDDELDAYKRHPEAYFGEINRDGGQIEDPYDLFEWLLDCYGDTPRERLLELAKDHPSFDHLKHLSDIEIRLALCEGWVISAMASAN